MKYRQEYHLYKTRSRLYFALQFDRKKFVICQANLAMRKVCTVESPGKNNLTQ